MTKRDTNAPRWPCARTMPVDDEISCAITTIILRGFVASTIAPMPSGAPTNRYVPFTNRQANIEDASLGARTNKVAGGENRHGTSVWRVCGQRTHVRRHRRAGACEKCDCEKTNMDKKTLAFRHWLRQVNRDNGTGGKTHETEKKHHRFQL